MEGDGRHRLAFVRDLDMLFSLYGLMQALIIAAAEHQAARKFVDNDNFAVFNDIIDVKMHNAVRLNGLINMVRKRIIFEVREIFQTEMLFGFLNAARRQCDRSGFFIDNVVGVNFFVLIQFVVDIGKDLLFQFQDELVRLRV